MKKFQMLWIIPSLLLSPAHAQNSTNWEAQFDSAGAEFNVPPILLKAIAFVETRWQPNMPALESDGSDHKHPHPPAYGIMGIRNDDWFGHRLEQAAQLIHQDSEALKWDMTQNIRGAAALLRDYAGSHPLLGQAQIDVQSSLIAWQDAVKKYSGIPDADDQATYLHDVYRVISEGHSKDGIDIEGFGTLIPEDPPSDPGQEANADYPGATWDASPNFTTDAIAPQFVVIHITEGSFAGAVSWLKNPAAQVSSHYVIRSSDGYVKQLVREKDRAWHARCWNRAAIGIEHEGFANSPHFITDQLYASSARLVRNITARYSIERNPSYVIGHDNWSKATFPGSPLSKIGTCNDHLDPGTYWDWNLYLELVRGSTP